MTFWRRHARSWEPPNRLVAEPARCCAVVNKTDTKLRAGNVQPSFGWDWVPTARPARKTSLFMTLTFGGSAETKKPGPSLLQVAIPLGRGSPVSLRLPVCNWCSSDLLFGITPTDTRPQARAKVGGREIRFLHHDARVFLLKIGIFSEHGTVCGASAPKRGLGGMRQGKNSTQIQAI